MEPETLRADLRASSLGRAFHDLERADFLRITRSEADTPYGRHGRFSGVWDGRHAYLVAGSIRHEDAIGKALHEITHASCDPRLADVWGHANLCQLIGERRFIALIAQMLAWLDAGEPRTTRAFARVPHDTPRELVEEESLCYLVEEVARERLPGVRAKIRAFAFAAHLTRHMTPEAIAALAMLSASRLSKCYAALKTLWGRVMHKTPAVARLTLWQFVGRTIALVTVCGLPVMTGGLLDSSNHTPFWQFTLLALLACAGVGLVFGTPTWLIGHWLYTKGGRIGRVLTSEYNAEEQGDIPLARWKVRAAHRAFYLGTFASLVLWCTWLGDGISGHHVVLAWPATMTTLAVVAIVWERLRAHMASRGTGKWREAFK